MGDETHINEDGIEVDKYGNPTDGEALPFCCFPDCGCDGARLCMAKSGANPSATALNLERRNLAMLTQPTTQEE